MFMRPCYNQQMWFKLIVWMCADCQTQSFRNVGCTSCCSVAYIYIRLLLATVRQIHDPTATDLCLLRLTSQHGSHACTQANADSVPCWSPIAPYIIRQEVIFGTTIL